jgi:hypothetical protein
MWTDHEEVPGPGKIGPGATTAGTTEPATARTVRTAGVAGVAGLGKAGTAGVATAGSARGDTGRSKPAVMAPRGGGGRSTVRRTPTVRAKGPTVPRVTGLRVTGLNGVTGLGRTGPSGVTGLRARMGGASGTSQMDGPRARPLVLAAKGLVSGSDLAGCPVLPDRQARADRRGPGSM